MTHSHPHPHTTTTAHPHTLYETDDNNNGKLTFIDDNEDEEGQDQDQDDDEEQRLDLISDDLGKNNELGYPLTTTTTSSALLPLIDSTTTTTTNTTTGTAPGNGSSNRSSNAPAAVSAAGAASGGASNNNHNSLSYLNAENERALTKLNQNIQKLKRPKPKKPTNGPKSRPAFIIKLWSMVNDPKNDQYIKWAPDGKSFIVSNRESFMKFILPKYFKHNNFASFVRQLNMYGWHKVQDVTHESNTLADDNNSTQESWQFENQNFIRDREDLLDNIIRNKSTKEDEELDFNALLTELESIKMNQIAIVEDIRRIRTDNQLLWEENFAARERHDKQTHAIDKIMRFLHQIYANGGNNRLEAPNNFNFGDLVQSTQYYQPQPQSQQQQQQQDPSQQGINYGDNNNYDDSIAQMMGNMGDYNNNTNTNNNNDNNVQFNKPRLMLTQQAHKRTNSNANNNNNNNNNNNSNIQEITSDQGTPASVNNNNPTIQEIIDDHNDELTNGEVVPSPRLLFPELQQGSNTTADTTNSSTASSITAAAQAANNPYPSDPMFIDKLEENISRQGQSIQQVNDWIARLNSIPSTSANANANASTADLENGFDMDDFLANSPHLIEEFDDDDDDEDRVNEIVDDQPVTKKRKTT